MLLCVCLCFHGFMTIQRLSTLSGICALYNLPLQSRLRVLLNSTYLFIIQNTDTHIKTSGRSFFKIVFCSDFFHYLLPYYSSIRKCSHFSVPLSKTHAKTTVQHIYTQCAELKALLCLFAFALYLTPPTPPLPHFLSISLCHSHRLI